MRCRLSAVNQVVTGCVSWQHRQPLSQNVFDTGRDGVNQLRGLQRQFSHVRHVSVRLRRRRAHSKVARLLAHRLPELPRTYHRGAGARSGGRRRRWWRRGRGRVIPVSDMSWDNHGATRWSRRISAKFHCQPGSYFIHVHLTFYFPSTVRILCQYFSDKY